MKQESAVSQTTLGTVLPSQQTASRTMPKPSELVAKDFARYPVEARGLAEHRLSLLQLMPLPLLPILLREISTFDWKFPVERAQLLAQLEWLATLLVTQRQALVSPFAEVNAPVPANVDWINDPPAYIEQLTASLWSNNSMPAFRRASEQYAEALRKAVPPQIPARPRVCIVVLDASLRDQAGRSASFSALRPHGVSLTGLQPANGFNGLLEWVGRRTVHASDASAYTNWYVDGGSLAEGTATQGLALVSYSALDPVRRRLLQRAQQALSSRQSGPEELRSLMVRFTPPDLGLPADADPVLTRFQLALLTEGSGTQIFATTFVQWAAREVLRRAEPEVLLLRFRPRQRQQAMNEMLSGAASLGPDLHGSLIDAEQGAYYTWVNSMRLPGAENAFFLAWQEGTSEAVIIGPGLPRGTVSPSHANLPDTLDRLT